METDYNNLGRPVINSINCHTSAISRFADYHPQSIVREIPSYIKDTNETKLKNLKFWKIHF